LNHHGQFPLSADISAAPFAPKIKISYKKVKHLLVLRKHMSHITACGDPWQAKQGCISSNHGQKNQVAKYIFSSKYYFTMQRVLKFITSNNIRRHQKAGTSSIVFKRERKHLVLFLFLLHEALMPDA
jgi:hypothetical protein